MEPTDMRKVVEEGVRKTAYDEGYKHGLERGRRIGHLDALRDAVATLADGIMHEANS